MYIKYLEDISVKVVLIKYEIKIILIIFDKLLTDFQYFISINLLLFCNFAFA